MTPKNDDNPNDSLESEETANIIAYNDFEEDDLSSSTSSSWYDDFGGVPIGEEDDTSDALLQSELPELNPLAARIAAVQREEQRRDAIGDRNWKLGNWQVRGFSIEAESAASVSVIVTSPIPEDDVAFASEHRVDLWVGRTDGCLFGIQLGTDYWTRLNLSDDDIDSAAVSERVLTENELDLSEEIQFESSSPVTAKNDPFRIVTQFQVGSAALSSIAVFPLAHNEDDGEDHYYIFTGTQGSTELKRWYYNGCNHQISWNATMTGDHTGASLLALKVIPNPHNSPNVAQRLLSVDDTSIVIWDFHLGLSLGSVNSIQLPIYEGSIKSVSDSQTILCVDTDGSHVFVGTSFGYVLIYAVEDILQAQDKAPVRGYWRATTDDCSITAIKCGGFGTLGRTTLSTKSLVLLTGDTNGVVKQWEVLQISSPDGVTYKMEAWPKLSSQRLPKKAHLFMGHEDVVTSLLSVDAVKFVSASADGTGMSLKPCRLGMHFFYDLNLSFPSHSVLNCSYIAHCSTSVEYRYG
jgi:hypothetical protein